MAATANSFVVGANYQGQDAHNVPQLYGQQITTYQGIKAAGQVPTVAATSNAGTLASIGSQGGYDQAGSFVLTAGTASTAAGTLLTVTFGQPLTASPSSVIVTAANTTASATTTITTGALAVSKTGFAVYSGLAPSVNNTYLISYQVIR